MFFSGIAKVKTEPTPFWLFTVIEPPMSLANRRVMAKPRPVPPNFRVVLSSACEKTRKIRSHSSSEMPIPVSSLKFPSLINSRASYPLLEA